MGGSFRLENRQLALWGIAYLRIYMLKVDKTLITVCTAQLVEACGGCQMERKSGRPCSVVRGQVTQAVSTGVARG